MAITIGWLLPRHTYLIRYRAEGHEKMLHGYVMSTRLFVPGEHLSELMAQLYEQLKYENIKLASMHRVERQEWVNASEELPRPYQYANDTPIKTDRGAHVEQRYRLATFDGERWYSVASGEQIVIRRWVKTTALLGDEEVGQ